MNQERKQRVITLLGSTGRQGIEDVIEYMQKTAVRFHQHSLQDNKQ